MKTEIEIKIEHQQSSFKVGDKGYIDGYIKGGDNRPYCCVVIGESIELIPFYCLKIIKTLENE